MADVINLIRKQIGVKNMRLSFSKLKFTKFDLRCFGFAFLFILYLPTFVTRIVDIPNWGVICYTIILISDVYFLYKLRKITKPVWLTAAFFGYFLAITLFQNINQMFNCLLRTYIAISFVLLMEYIFSRYDGNKCICILMRAMEIFNYLNLLFMLLYPAGMYQVVANGIYEELIKVEPGSARRSAARVLWLLGHQTMMIRFTLPAICLALVYCCLKTGKFKLNLRGALLIVVCLAETIIANSAGNFLILAVLAAVLILFHFNGKVKVQYIFPFIVIAYVFLMFSSGDLSIYTWLTNALQRNVQISTRVPIWLNTFNAWMERPILGHGFINDGIKSIRLILTAGNPHSSYLWVLYEGGLLGIGLMIYYIQFFARRMKDFWSNGIARIIYASFICLLICMIDDDHMFRSQFYIIIFELTYHIPEIANSVYKHKYR